MENSTYELFHSLGGYNSRNSKNMDGMVALVDKCMSSYDINGWESGSGYVSS
jgi:hypothetical protein